MQTLKSYAVKEKKTIVTTIHQPSSQIFYMFDKLLLLCGGQVAYFGDINGVVQFFSKIGYQISPNYNPADFIMEKVKGSPSDQEKIIAGAKELPKSPPTHYHRSIRSINKANTCLNQSSYDDGPKQDLESQELSEKNPLWPQPHHHYHHQEKNEEKVDKSGNDNDDSADHQTQTDSKGLELRVLIDPCCKKIQVYSKIVQDDDSGRSSWTETDRSSTSTFSSASSSSREEMYFDYNNGPESTCPSSMSPSSSIYSSTHKSEEKWPTSFWTQLKVLTTRNFHEARGRMLSKLNWVQTIGLALLAGCIWFQVKRDESSLVDIKGWMYFSTTYWMLFALFGALISFPAEREVINKERSSGAYRYCTCLIDSN